MPVAEASSSQQRSSWTWRSWQVFGFRSARLQMTAGSGGGCLCAVRRWAPPGPGRGGDLVSRGLSWTHGQSVKQPVRWATDRTWWGQIGGSCASTVQSGVQCHKSQAACIKNTPDRLPERAPVSVPGTRPIEVMHRPWGRVSQCALGADGSSPAEKSSVDMALRSHWSSPAAREAMVVTSETTHCPPLSTTVHHCLRPLPPGRILTGKSQSPSTLSLSLSFSLAPTFLAAHSCHNFFTRFS